MLNRTAVRSLFMLAALVASGLSSLAFADTKTQAKKAWGNPILKQAVVGAAIGTATGAISREGTALKGAGVGALVGAGTGLMDTSSTLDRKPLVKTTAKGALIGVGASTITKRNKLSGAAIGAGAGAGTHFLKNYLRND